MNEHPFGDRILALVPYFRVWVTQLDIHSLILGAKSNGDVDFSAGELGLVLAVVENIPRSQPNLIESRLAQISGRYDRWTTSTSNKTRPFLARARERIEVPGAFFTQGYGKSREQHERTWQLAHSNYVPAARLFLRLIGY